MSIIFAILIVVLIAAALLHRRREKRSWLREERYDESGAWVDKRASERGTYGRLDAEREAERYALTRQGRISDLALDLRNFAFEHVPGFHERSDAQLRAFTQTAKAHAAELFAAAEALLDGQSPETAEPPSDTHPLAEMLKKRILHALYDQYPALLDLDLDVIRQLDQYVVGKAAGLLNVV